MTVETYKAKYEFMNSIDYGKLSKAQMIEVIAEFYDGFENGVQEYCMPTGDSWIWQMEINWWWTNFPRDFKPIYNRPQRDENGNAVSKTLMSKKKEHLVEYICVLDLAYASMNEVSYKHRYHDCLRNLRKRFNSRRK